MAEAIWRADHEGTVDVRGLEWEKSVYRDHYCRMAQAAIDALGLTEERGILAHQMMGTTIDSGHIPIVVLDDARATHSRLTGPWVRVEEQP